MDIQETAKANRCGAWKEPCGGLAAASRCCGTLSEKFPQDTIFGKPAEAAANGDLSGIETAAHTLKGVAGNLGFTALYEGYSGLVAAVWAEEQNRWNQMVRRIFISWR